MDATDQGLNLLKLLDKIKLFSLNKIIISKYIYSNIKVANTTREENWHSDGLQSYKMQGIR